MPNKRIQVIKSLLIWEDKISVAPLMGGITNFNYLITDGQKKYVARFSSTSSSLLGINRTREAKNTRLAFASHLGPRVVKFFPHYNLRIAEYIEGKVFTPSQGRKSANIKRIAQFFKKLHNGPKLSGTFDPFKTVEGYIAVARAKKWWTPSDIDLSLLKLRRLESLLKPVRLKMPCHLDLMVENVIDVKDGIKLIDWEYSANSDPCFDLAMFSVKGNFTTRHDDILLKAYGLKIPRPQFEAMKAVVYFREGAWGLLQLAASDIKFDYKKYATDNLSSFNMLADKLLF